MNLSVLSLPSLKRLAVCLMTAIPACFAYSQNFEFGFEATTELDALSNITGTVEIDQSFSRSGNGSLKIEPGSEAHLILRAEDGGALVTMWVYDDMTTPADHLVHRVGPRWGLEQSNGRILASALIYAPYLRTDNNFVSTYHVPAGTWFSVQYLSQAPRREGWRKWVFDMDPEEALKIYIDDREVTAFDWAKTDFRGMVGLAFYGDVVDDESQTIWIDDLTIELKGPMVATPENNPDTPVPPTDPEHEGPPIGLADWVDETVHPRLLFTTDRIQGMKRLRNEFTNEGRFFQLQLDNYAGWASRQNFTRDFQTNATKGQEFGLWWLPSIAMHYLLTGEAASLSAAQQMMSLLLNTDHWETGGEISSGMSAGNIMAGAALAFDWLYEDLNANFRENFREKLWLQARRMYYYGHLKRTSSTHYWQNDPGNNHRFHRNIGLVLATLAAYRGEPEQDWLLARVKEEMDFVVHYLPIDGTSHESPSYYIFGLPHITFACWAMDKNMGTRYMDHPYFKNGPMFRAQMTAPNFSTPMLFGDAAGGFGAYNTPLLGVIWRHNLVNEYAVIDRVRRDNTNDFGYTWMAYAMFEEDRPSDRPEPGSLDKVPTRVRFQDLDLAVIRDGWNTTSKAALFKSGPFGGYALNEYRDDYDFSYINVAHDDPDANSFIIWKNGTLVAESDRYSYSKKSANHNTLLINGKGQQSPGRSEGGQWTQPSTANRTMKDMAYMTGWKDAGDIVFAEGEAKNSYPGTNLTRYRRSFIWNEGKYVLVLDDIRASQSLNYTWLIQSKVVNEVNMAEGRYQLEANENAKLDFQLVSSSAFNATIGNSPADNRGTLLGFRQLQVASSGTDVKFASVYAVWDGALTVDLDLADANNATIRVTGGGFVDTWTWEASPDDRQPGTFVLTSTDGQSLDSVLDPADEYFLGLNFRSESWMKSSWFGWLYPDAFPWVYSLEHGWTYLSGDEASKYLWIDGNGWHLTNHHLYPWVFSYDQGEWINLAAQ